MCSEPSQRVKTGWTIKRIKRGGFPRSSSLFDYIFCWLIKDENDVSRKKAIVVIERLNVKKYKIVCRFNVVTLVYKILKSVSLTFMNNSLIILTFFM